MSDACPACAALNPPGTAFCGRCGARLPRAPGPERPSERGTGPERPGACPACGAPLAPTAPFCGACGAESPVPTAEPPPLAAELVDGKGDHHPLSGIITIGRDAGNGLPIADPAISRVHCRIDTRWVPVLLRDLQSRNGTWLNGRRIRAEELTDGDRITIGRTELQFHARPANGGPLGPGAAGNGG